MSYAQLSAFRGGSLIFGVRAHLYTYKKISFGVKLKNVGNMPKRTGPRNGVQRPKSKINFSVFKGYVPKIKLFF